jgi:hypothetical protein
MDARAARECTEELCAQVSDPDRIISSCAKLVARFTSRADEQFLASLWGDVAFQVEYAYGDVWNDSKLLLEKATSDNVVLVIARDALLASFAQGMVHEGSLVTLSDRWLKTLLWSESVSELTPLARQAFVSAAPTWTGSFEELLNASVDSTV